MLIIFASGNHWISRTIKRSTKSIWTHVGIIDGNQVIESVGPPVRELLAHALFNTKYKKQYGVVETPLEQFKARYQQTETRYIEGNIEIARARLGMPFDMFGLLCAYLLLDWHDPKKDFCVETVAYAISSVENHIAHRMTPDVIYWLSERILGTK